MSLLHLADLDWPLDIFEYVKIFLSINTIIFSFSEMFLMRCLPCILLILMHFVEINIWIFVCIFYLLQDNFESRECVIGVSSASCWSWCTFLENLEECRTHAIPDICILRCEFFSRGWDFLWKVPTNHQHLWRWCQISGLTGAQYFVSLFNKYNNICSSFAN